ncbi:C12orf10 [Branchiostoma lanceolatum]|uniref:C12orf10 protein n=1 Tax=Branchiostoma lanceolatum TaxID=7740 RepID=A0A8K0A5N2_BRALA|nr:C12orf10 [Branchiostoma lanceolatum]
MSQPNKKLRENGDEKQIGTHDGTFHCDEALACHLLKRLPRFRDHRVVRTRKPDLLADCDIVVDVGGQYDPATHRYDHHQRSFNETMNSLVPDKPWVTKLSSAGLVYLHFGQEIIANMLGEKADKKLCNVVYDKEIIANMLGEKADKKLCNVVYDKVCLFVCLLVYLHFGQEIIANMLGEKADKKLCNVVYDKVYQNLIEEIDAIDNGVSQFDGSPRYLVTTNLSSRVGRLNPAWNEEDQDTNERFCKAMEMVGEEFEDRVRYYSQAWWPGRKLVQDALEARHSVDSSGEVILMEQVCPWKEHLFDLEKDMKVDPSIKYVLYADQGGNWRVQCVPVATQSFESRLALPEEWRGVRDEELSKLSGIPGCVFVHASGFIGGNKTREGALLMAQRALQMCSKLSGIPGCVFVHASGFIGGNTTREGALLMAQRALQMCR